MWLVSGKMVPIKNIHVGDLASGNACVDATFCQKVTFESIRHRITRQVLSKHMKTLAKRKDMEKGRKERKGTAGHSKHMEPDSGFS